MHRGRETVQAVSKTRLCCGLVLGDTDELWSFAMQVFS